MTIVITPKQMETLKIALEMALAETLERKNIELYRDLDDVALEIYEQED